VPFAQAKSRLGKCDEVIWYEETNVPLES